MPRRLAKHVESFGHEAVHTLDLARGNLSTDGEIGRLAVESNAVVATKDQDFVDSFLLRGIPSRLLHITTGNIPNSELIDLIEKNWDRVLSMFTEGDYVELSHTAVTLHC